jgi:hypothetical protein
MGVTVHLSTDCRQQTLEFHCSYLCGQFFGPTDPALCSGSARFDLTMCSWTDRLAQVRDGEIPACDNDKEPPTGLQGSSRAETADWWQCLPTCAPGT